VVAADDESLLLLLPLLRGHHVTESTLNVHSLMIDAPPVSTVGSASVTSTGDYVVALGRRIVWQLREAEEPARSATGSLGRALEREAEPWLRYGTSCTG
jgi:hypothetical protein